MKSLSSVKVGDVVTRYLGGKDGVAIKMIVCEVSKNIITCALWTFDRQTGAEIDEDLGWGPYIGTGSYIVPFEDDTL